MANQITIDIVAQTSKLTSGIKDANGQIDGMSTKLKGIASTAGIAASGFLATKGLTFLKQGIDEAKEAQEVMTRATTTFGEGSDALKKITEDAEKFGKELAIDNDELIDLATQLGSRLPKEIQASSTELVKIFKDVEAFTGGAVTAEAAGGRLAKAFQDGELKAKELQKVFPGLEQSVYDQAEALSAAGDNQGALNKLTEEGQKKYGDAAAKNVTSTQKFETALADFKEQLGTKVLPILEKGIDFLTKMFEAFDKLPGPVKDILIVLGVLLTVGSLVLIFLASMTTAMTTLGIISGGTATGVGLAATATKLLTAAMKGLPILAVIALIVLLIQNWDTVSETAKKVFEAIKEFFGKAYEFVKEAIGKAISWVKENWPLILAILTGPIGLAIKYIVDNFDKIKDKAGEIISRIKDIFGGLPETMLNVGKNIVMGLWNGMQNMVGWLRDKVTGFFKNLLPDWAEKALGIASPSKVFAKIGTNIVKGLQSTFNAPAIKSVSNAAKAGIAVPTASLPSLMSSSAKSGVNITINAGLGTNGAQLGRQVSSAIKQYGKVSTQTRF
jgi:hypothetical protein